MNVLFLTKYGAKAASCRYRFIQYIPHLDRQSVHCTVSPLFDDKYLENKFTYGKARIGDVLRAFFRRTMAILSAEKYDLTVVHCEAFPYFPRVFELYLKKRRINYIFDYDDAIFHNYDLHRSPLVRRVFGDKIRKVIADAVMVFAGSEYLANYARQVNNNVRLLRTVVDLNNYPPTTDAGDDGIFTIGWIGSPSTAEYVKEIEPALREFCANHPARLLLIGSGEVDLRDVPAEVRAWSGEREVADLLECDVGIMPLSDTPWARGKCGFKLIQYMACGLPVIASPVGVNADIVEHGVNGYLAGTNGEWFDAFVALYEDKAAGREMGKRGRADVEAKFCLQINADRMAQFLQEAVQVS